MKKIILLLSIFLLTGCFDYTELNDLSIVSMIIIDKIDNNYSVSFEILNDQKTKDEEVNTSIIVTSSGTTIADAINNTIMESPKQAYLSHLKILAISKDVAKEDLKSICEYFLRSPYIRNEFYLTIVDNNQASDILKAKSNQTPILSENIYQILKSNKKTTNNITNNNFENILIDIFEKGKDAIIPVIKEKDNNIKATSNALINNYKLKTILDPNDSSLLNILKNNVSNMLFTYSCPNNNGNITLSMYSGKTNYSISKKILSINVKLMAEIEEYTCHDDLKDSNTFKKYNDYYANILKEDISDLYSKLLNNKTDALGIGKILYIKKRFYNEDDWLTLKYNINIDLKINKEGLIYEVNNGN